MQVICFEGINGSGKTCQSRMMAERLRRTTGRDVYEFCDPGVEPKHPLGTELRRLARRGDCDNEMTRMLLYMSARCELIAELDGLKDVDCFVVLDRYAMSFYAYGLPAFAAAAERRGVHASEAKGDMVALLRMCGAHTPNVTVLLQVEPDVAVQRCGTRLDHYESGGLDQMRDLGKRYKTLAEDYRFYPFVGANLIVAPQQHWSSARVHDHVWNEIVEENYLTGVSSV